MVFLFNYTVLNICAKSNVLLDINRGIVLWSHIYVQDDVQKVLSKRGQSVEEAINPECCSGLPVTLVYARMLNIACAMLWMLSCFASFEAGAETEVHPHAIGSFSPCLRLNITAALFQWGSRLRSMHRPGYYYAPWTPPLCQCCCVKAQFAVWLCAAGYCHCICQRCVNPIHLLKSSKIIILLNLQGRCQTMHSRKADAVNFPWSSAAIQHVQKGSEVHYKTSPLSFIMQEGFN